MEGSGQQIERNTARIGKLDSLFLWVSSLSGLGFAVFVAYLRTPIALYIPIFALIVYSVVVGYVNGAILRDSFTERIRGWNYLFMGLCFYVPSAALQFSEFLSLRISFYLRFVLPTAITLIYVLSSFKFAIPKIYASLKFQSGNVAHSILKRSTIASIYLSCILYFLALVSYAVQIGKDPSLQLGVPFFLLFLAPLIFEEITIQRLLGLENYQQFLDECRFIESKRLWKLAMCLLFLGAFAIVAQLELFGKVEWTFWIPLFISGISFTVIALYLLILSQLRGKWEISLRDGVEKELPEDQLKDLQDHISKVSGSRPKKRNDSELEKKDIRFIGAHFFAIFFLIGLFITLIGAGLFFSYQHAPSYTIQPNYMGFGIAQNYTQNIDPRKIRISISLSKDRPVLFFRYEFAVAEDGSYNFLFFFPFEVTDHIYMSEGMKCNTTPYGTAVWVEHSIANLQAGWRSNHVHGSFHIANTFQSGTRGDYTFLLPFIGGVGGDNTTEKLQHELNVAWHTDAEVELVFVVPSRFQIVQAYPQKFLGPDTFSISGNRTVNRIIWNLQWPDQQFTILCRNSEETAYYQSVLFFSGLFISTGASISTRSVYDKIKETVNQEPKCA